jgi:dipeptidyl-peptidase-4
MGLPDDNAQGYEASSALTYAKDLTRPLLVLHGTTDDNVYFLHALKLSDALFRAGRDHAFQPLVGFTHMVPDPAVSARLQTRVLRFLLDALGVSGP